MADGSWAATRMHSGLKNEEQEVHFDIIIPTPKGALYCMYHKRVAEMAMAATNSSTRMNIIITHDLLGHCREDMT